eukprot:6177956-Pleurochrysis_carterae.AAC.4
MLSIDFCSLHISENVHFNRSAACTSCDRAEGGGLVSLKDHDIWSPRVRRREHRRVLTGTAKCGLSAKRSGRRIHSAMPICRFAHPHAKS